MHRVRRAFALAATAVLTYGVLGVGVTRPASANTQAELHVAKNQTVTRTYQAPLGGAGAGAGYNLVNGFHRADCEDGAEPTSEICDYIPVKLDVPESELAKGTYALAFTLTWPTTNAVVPGFAAFAEDGLSMSVWDDPEYKDDDAPPNCGEAAALIDLSWTLCQVLGPSGGDPGGDEAYVSTFMYEEPIRFGMVPKKTAYAVTIENDYGMVPEFTLSVSLVAPDNFVDLSIENPAIPDLSAAATATPTQSFSGDTSGPLPPTSLEVLGAANLSPDQDFSGIDLGDLQLDKSEIVRNAVRQGIRRPGNEKGVYLLLWLVLLPVVAIAAVGVWLLRKRASVFAL